MRIVMLVDAVYEDAVGGSRVVARELARGLAARGHEVTFVAPDLVPLGLAARGSQLAVGSEVSLMDPARPARGEREARGRIDGVRSREPRAASPSGTSYDIIRVPHCGPLDLITGVSRTVRGIAAHESTRDAALSTSSVERRASSVDLLHVHFAYPAVGLSLWPVSGVPVVRSFYGSWASEAREENEGLTGCGSPPLHSLRRAADALSLRRSRRVIVLSRYSWEEVVQEYRIADTKVDLIPGGVDLARFRPGCRRTARLGLGLPEERPVLLTIRRLVPRMGLDALIEAMVAVRQARPDVLLLVGGKGPLLESLQTQAARLGLEKTVRFIGFIPDEQLATYYQAADLFILPTRALEGFGLPTLEAFACGTPVLGTPVGATPELLREVDPDLILPGITPEAMARGVIAFLRGPERPSCSSARLRAFVESRFSWDAVVDATLAVYHRAREEGA